MSCRSISHPSDIASKRIDASRDAIAEKRKLKKRRQKSEKLGFDYEVIVENRIDDLLFDEHIYERLRFFGENLKFREISEDEYFDSFYKGSFFGKRELLLPYQDVISLREVSDDEKKIAALYRKAIRKNYTLMSENDSKQGRFNRQSVRKTVSFEAFTTFCKNAKNIYSESYLISPTQYASPEELKELRLLRREESSDKYSLPANTEFVEGGFRRMTHSLPFRHEKSDKKFYMDVVVYTEGKGGVIFDEGHASLMLTSPSGEVYSFGLFDESDSSFYNIEAPDVYTFVPRHKKRIKRYEIANVHDFREILHYIDAEVKISEKNGIAYDALTRNCAHFCSRVVQFAKNNCEIVKESTLISTLDKAYVKSKIIFLQILIFLAKIWQSLGFTIPNKGKPIDFNKIQIPLQLLF